jgi:hypothetical protein
MADTIAASLQGRDNNFNLIKFIAASAVLVDHSFALVAPEQAAGAAIDFEALESAVSQSMCSSSSPAFSSPAAC